MKEEETKAQKIWNRLIMPHLKIGIREKATRGKYSTVFDTDFEFKTLTELNRSKETDDGFALICPSFFEMSDEELDKILKEEEFKEHSSNHKADWIQDRPKCKSDSFGGNLHFECNVPNCEIYSDAFKCSKCKTRMWKKGGICSDCGLMEGLVDRGAIFYECQNCKEDNIIDKYKY